MGPALLSLKHAQSPAWATRELRQEVHIVPPFRPLLAQVALTPRNRSKYRFGRTLGAGTYGIVREAESADGRVAIKIILKKNVRGNERMVLDELEMLQRLKHPHIVKFVDWFESRVCC